MSLRFAKTRMVGRWGATVVALVVIGGTGLSWFYYYGGGCTVVGPGEDGGWGRWSRYSLMAGEGRVTLSLTPQSYSCFGGPPEESSGWARFVRPNGYPLFFMGVADGKRILYGSQTIGSTAGTEYQYYVSGFVPGGLFGLIAAWSWRGALKRRRLLRVGCCVGCGYSLEGLDGGVCPECGEGKGEE